MDADCDDLNPCNGVETCNLATGLCEPGSCDTRVVVLEEHFDTDAGPFIYQDDTFRGTSNPAFADGSFEPVLHPLVPWRQR